MSEPAAKKPTKKPKKSMAGAWREARALMWTHRRRLALGLVLMLVSRISGLVLPASSKLLVDDVIGKRNLELLPWLALGVATATVIQAMTAFALSQVLGVAAQRAITEMRKRVMKHVSRLPVRYYDSTQTGILISRVMNDAEGIRNLVGTGLVELSGGMVTAVLASGVLFYLNWKLTLIMLAVLLLSGGGMAFAFQKLRPLFRERWKIEGEVSGRLGETLGGIRIVKAYTAEKREQRAFARGAHRLFRNVARTMTGASAVFSLSGLILGAVGVIMMLVGGRAVLGGEMTLGSFFMYVSFTGVMAGPVIQLTSIGTQLSEAFAGLDRIREIMSEPTEDTDGKAHLPSVRGDIAFEHVGFEYVADTPVLKDISFRAPAGSTTALVGASGGGKSTMAGLVMAFHRPKTGRVLVDGRDLADLSLRDFRSTLGVVLQDNFLFDGTIFENIAFSRPDASLEQIREVGRIAHCDEFVSRFEKGYDTIVGERGVKLSGGQRQRVAIARAILADPRVLILDEATSSLDSESEAMIQDGLRALRRGRTTFVIAHRLSTIRSADQILVVEGGQIAERGTHAHLLAVGGRYKQLYDRQYQIESDLFINPGEDFTPEPVRAKATPEGEGAGVPRM